MIRWTAMVPRAVREPGLALLAIVAAGCHVVERTPDLHPGPADLIVHRDRGRVLPATLIVTGDGRFRFVEPVRCPTTEVVNVEASTLVTVRPNLATFVVGTILGSLGAIATGVALSGDDP